MRRLTNYRTALHGTLLLAMLGVAALIGAAPSVGGEIGISMPWARATPPVATIGAAYLELKADRTPDKLVGAFSSVAERIEMHTTVDNKGVMQMRRLQEIPVVPGKPLRFAPGGMHLMLIGLRAPLVAGTNFPLTLRFAAAGDVTVDVVVLKDAPVSGQALH